MDLRNTPRGIAVWVALAPFLLVSGAAGASLTKPSAPQDRKVVGQLLATDFSRQCDLSTYPLKKNLTYLFENKYIGLEFRSWEVRDGRVVLHYVDGEAGPTTATWEVVPGGEADFRDENAEVLSCMTGYL